MPTLTPDLDLAHVAILAEETGKRATVARLFDFVADLTEEVCLAHGVSREGTLAHLADILQAPGYLR